jgi:YHS domain-containing protein
MRVSRFFGLLATLLTLGTGASAADQKTDSISTELKAQTLCPVMGKKIDSTSFTDIQGQRVYHCCPKCSEKLVADPDKYFKKSASQGVLFENIQKNCPVSGEALEDRDVYSDFEGRRIYFCCKKCQKKFAENPQQYLKGMDAPTEQEMAPAEDHSGHDQSGHSGH